MDLTAAWLWMQPVIFTARPTREAVLVSARFSSSPPPKAAGRIHRFTISAPTAGPAAMGHFLRAVWHSTARVISTAQPLTAERMAEGSSSRSRRNWSPGGGTIRGLVVDEKGNGAAGAMI